MQVSAANRDFNLYRRLKAEADPVEVERLVLDTGKVGLREAVERAVAYIRAERH